MKNVFRGLSAKLALALLAVGALSSCYEKEELDVQKTDDPITPVCYIQGNVSDVETGKPLEAKITIKDSKGASVYSATATNGYFTYKYENTGDETYTVEADCDFYFTVSKTIFIPKGDYNTVSAVTLDFALVSVNSPVAPDPDDPESLLAPATDEEATEVAKQRESDVKNSFSGAGIEVQDMTVENGVITVTSKTKSVSAAYAGSYTFDLPLTSGFVSTITPNTSVITRANVGQVWLAYAEQALKMKYGFTDASDKLRKITFPGRLGYSITAYDVKATYATRTISFEGKEGTVMYQERVVITVKYESHNTHDSHDSHDVHDSHGVNSPGAGGGSSQGE